MSVFTHYERSAGIVSGCIFFHPVDAWIHGADYVGVTVFTRLFELYGARTVALLYPVICCMEILAVAAFVAERPDDNARMVFVALHKGDLTVENRSLPFRTFGRMTVVDPVPGSRAHCMGLDVGFVHKIDAVAVAEIIPQRRLGIVACAHGVDIMALHRADVIHHRLAVNHMALGLVMLMEIDSVDLKRTAVDHQAAVFDLDFAESGLCRC